MTDTKPKEQIEILQGLMGRDWSHMRGCDDAILKTWVTSAYAIADLMIVERNKNEH